MFPLQPEECLSFVNSNVGRNRLPASLHSWSVPVYNSDEKDSALLHLSCTVSLCFISIMTVHVFTNTDVCITVSLQPGLTQNITTALKEEDVDFIAPQNIWDIYIVIVSSLIRILEKCSVFRNELNCHHSSVLIRWRRLLASWMWRRAVW